MNLHLSPDEIPYLPRGVRVTEDRVRGGKVLLAPEKAVALDPIGDAILSRIDGQTSFGALIDDLVDTYQAPREQISDDVQTFLSGLRSRMFLAVKPQ